MSTAVVQISKPEKMPSGRDLIRASLSGSFGSDDVKLLSGWAEAMGKAVRDVHNEGGTQLAILIDIRELGTYNDPELINIITSLMKDDGPYIYRTATYGGTPLHVMIQGVISSISSRKNLKNFKTEDEALKWLAE